METRTVTIGGQPITIETLLRRLRAYDSGAMTNKGIETWMQNHIAEIRKAVESRRKRNPTVTIGGQTLAVATLRDRLQRYNAGTLTPVGIETWMTKNLPEIKAKLKAGTPNKL